MPDPSEQAAQTFTPHNFTRRECVHPDVIVVTQYEDSASAGIKPAPFRETSFLIR